MENISSTSELKYVIQLLEEEQQVKSLEVKQQYYTTLESIKPINLLKSSLKDAVTPSHLQDDLLIGALSIASGYMAKKLILGASPNIPKRIIGLVLQFGITSVMSQGFAPVALVRNLISRFSSSKKNVADDEKE